MGRLRVNLNQLNTIINTLLADSTPSSRLLSGEAIIFQNEMLDIFKEVINASIIPMNEESKVQLKSGQGLKPRYVIAIIQEFIRSLLENSIPQQPSQ